MINIINTINNNNKIIDLQNTSSKILRKILTKMLFEKATSVAKLEKEGFTADEISHIYELPFKLTLDVRLSVFFNLRLTTIFCTQKVDSLGIR